MSTTAVINNLIDVMGYGEFVDPETGEAVTAVPVARQLLERDIKENINRNIIVAKNRNKSNGMDKLLYEVGKGKGFYFSHYINLLKVIDNDLALAFRFLYLCTYGDFNGVLRNYERKMKCTIDDPEKNLITDDELLEIFHVGKSEAHEIRKKMYSTGLIYKDKNRIRVNDEYYLKGKLNNNKEFVGNSTRVFENGIREIYNNSNSREHKFIGLIIPLLPYINYQHNVLCWNPECQEPSEIKPMSLVEACKIMNYSSSNPTRMKNKLKRITVNNEYFIGFWETNGTKSMIVNPAVFYCGCEKTALEGVINLFKMNRV